MRVYYFWLSMYLKVFMIKVEIKLSITKEEYLSGKIAGQD